MGDQVWWTEFRPSEGGRQAVRRLGADGKAENVLPPPWNARTRVHEYGGASWTVAPDGSLLFTEFTDQRLYRLVPGSGNDPEPLTPVGHAPTALRFAEPQVAAGGTELWCIRESHQPDGSIRRDVCAIPLDGSAAEDESRIRSVVSGSHFLAYARISPDGSKLAWIAWEHPQMPWDGTELRVAELTDGVCGPWRTLIGSTSESVLQPEWIDNDNLYAISDRSGWWNLYRVSLAEGAEPQPLCPRSEDFGGALWNLGQRWYAPLEDGKLLTLRTLGSDWLGVLDPATGELTDIDLGDLTTLALNGMGHGNVLLTCGGARTGTGVRALNLTTHELTDVALTNDDLPPASYLPEAREMSFTGPDGRDVHAFVYPPSNPDFRAPDGELPPYIAWIHGGPTIRASVSVNLQFAFFTSRGLGVIDINYGGSTGYGREYRDRLRGQWGVVDVEDTVAAMQGLVDAGMADGNRLGIEGGSAGGWTVLCALTGTKAFTCGVSYFGVSDLENFVETTHDFESRYLDSLVGPLPEALELYRTRTPLARVNQLSCPVLLLQGLDDPVVPPSQSEIVRDALVANGIPHYYLEFPGESHGFRKAETQIKAAESEISFYGQVFGFTPPDVPVLKLWQPEEKQ